MATFCTHIFIDKLTSGAFNWLTSDIRVLLVGPTNNMTFTNTYITDTTILAEVTGAGYSRKTLAGLTFNYNVAKNAIYGDANDVVWTGLAGGSIGGWVAYVNVAGDTSSWYIGKSTDGTGFPANTIGGDFTLQFDNTAPGIVKIAGMTTAGS